MKRLLTEPTAHPHGVLKGGGGIGGIGEAKPSPFGLPGLAGGSLSATDVDITSPSVSPAA